MTVELEADLTDPPALPASDGPSGLCEARAMQVLKRWNASWPAPESIVAAAAQVARYKGVRIGDIVVAEGHLSQAVVDSLDHDTDTRTLFLDRLCALPVAHKLREIHYNEIVCYAKGYLYLEPDQCRTDLTFHDIVYEVDLLGAMHKQGIVVCCAAGLDLPILMFGDIDKLTKWRTQSAVSISNNPILAYLGIASPRDVIVGCSLRAFSEDVLAGLGDESHRAKSIETRFKPIAEIRQMAGEAGRLLANILDYVIERGGRDIDLLVKASGVGYVRYKRTDEYIELPAELCHIDADLYERLSRLILGPQITNAIGDGGRPHTEAYGRFDVENGSKIRKSARFHAFRNDYEEFGVSPYSINGAIRFFDIGSQLPSLIELGHQPSVVAKWRYALMRGKGLILFVAPMGHGKSTSLAGMFGEYQSMYGHTKKLLSAEDPAERPFDFATISLNRGKGESYLKVLRGSLRQDVDLLNVGECRDLDGLMAAVQAAIAGVLATSTMHASNCENTLLRAESFCDPGDFMTFLQALNMIVSQRLVTLVCLHCADYEHLQEGSPEAIAIRNAMSSYPFLKNQPLPDRIYRRSKKNAPCHHCGGTGDIQQIPAVEYTVFNPQVKRELAIEFSRAKMVSNTMLEIVAANTTERTQKQAYDLLLAGKMDYVKFIKVCGD